MESLDILKTRVRHPKGLAVTPLPAFYAFPSHADTDRQQDLLVLNQKTKKRKKKTTVSRRESASVIFVKVLRAEP
jgi:hypothetical protein